MFKGMEMSTELGTQRVTEKAQRWHRDTQSFKNDSDFFSVSLSIFSVNLCVPFFLLTGQENNS